MAAIIATPNGCRIHIHAAPRASKSKVVGLHDDRVKIQLAAPPVDGAANAELIKFLAALLHVPKADLQLVSGDTGKRKTVEVTGMPPEVAAERLNISA
jgi:uncharacterized protein (TIGR00251 family)